MSVAVDAAARLLGQLATRDAPLGARTTYRVGGNAAVSVIARSAADLRRVRTAVMETNLDVLVVGRGSNMLVADHGFDGLVVALEGELAEIHVAPDAVRAGGGASFPAMARQAAAGGAGGLEWAVGIPGSVGGAVRMNAGGHGSDVAACLRDWTFIDLRGGPDGQRGVADLAATYRHTAVGSAHVVIEATFDAQRVDPAQAEAKIGDIVRWRRENQPGGQNAGSVFTNPANDSAGRIIEAAGCKGIRIGTAEVSTKHANFIQADPGGRADDVRALIAEVQRVVREATGIELQTEVRMIGFRDAEVDPRVAKRRQEVARAAGRRRLRILLIVATGVMFLLGVVGLFFSPALDVDRVEVRGADRTSVAAVLQTTGLDAQGHAMVAVDRFALARRVERLPWVESAAVTRRWPNVVRVVIREREPLGAIGVPGGVALVDRGGRVLATASSPPPNTFPVLIAPSDKVPGPGHLVSPAVRSALTILRALSEDLGAKTEAVRRLAGEIPTYELVVRGGVTIRLGEAQRITDKLTAAEAVLAAEHAPGTIIDVRVPRSPAVTRTVTPASTTSTTAKS